jgi:hypothetical protein
MSTSPAHELGRRPNFREHHDDAERLSGEGVHSALLRIVFLDLPGERFSCSGNDSARRKQFPFMAPGLLC